MAETGEHGLMMLAIHDALRRDLEHLQRAADAEAAGTPAPRAAVLAGWTFFSSQLHNHHKAEDDDLWPRARASLAGSEADLALLDEMEAEHAVIGPAISEVDEAVRTQPADVDHLAEAIDRFRSALVTHLRHEERAALPLLERTLDARAWEQFSAQQTRQGRLRGLTEFMPWLLHDADPQRAAAVSGRLPPPLRIAVTRVALPRFAARPRW